MSFMERLHGESRGISGLASPEQWLIDALNPGGQVIGKGVTVDTALGLVPIYSAVSQIAGAVATLPMIVYKGEQERASSTQQWKLLHDTPNPELAADELWEIVTSHLLLWGNAYLWKVEGALGVKELWPISPRRVQTGRVDGVRTHFVDGAPYTDREILQIRGLSEDGLVGYSPIQVAKQAVANGLAQQEFVANFLTNGGKPSIVLSHPGSLTPEAAKRLKASWQTVKNGDTAVIEEGIKVETLTMPLNDAQFIEQQQYSDLRIAQMFNLPPSKLGAPSGDSMTYSNIEQDGQNFVTYTLNRWLVRIEKSLKRDAQLLRGDLSAKFLVEGLLRADTKTRFEAYKVALEAGFMDVEEIRERENLPQKEMGNAPSNPE